MKSTRKHKKVKRAEVLKGLKNIDVLFDELKQDASLPSFGEFFMSCLVIGNAECVNLKVLFPLQYERLWAWLENHYKSISHTH